MLQEKLKNRKLILASGSPRRKELLGMLGLDFIVKTKPTEEIYPDTLPVQQISEYLANLKAEAFRSEVNNDKSLIVIASDTLVAIDDEIFGKPQGRDDAVKMLAKLSGKRHSVYSGVSIISNDKSTSFTAKTDVWFREMTMQEIEYYIDSFHPFDKAGAYAVQEWVGVAAISKIEGSFYNVMGLPTQMLYVELEKFLT